MRAAECELRGWKEETVLIREKRPKRAEKGINARRERTQAPAARNKRALSHAHVVQNHRDYGES